MALNLVAPAVHACVCVCLCVCIFACLSPRKEAVIFDARLPWSIVEIDKKYASGFFLLAYTTPGEMPQATVNALQQLGFPCKGSSLALLPDGLAERRSLIKVGAKYMRGSAAVGSHAAHAVQLQIQSW